MDKILMYPPRIEPGQIRPIFLPGNLIQLEPLNSTHVDELTLAANDPEIWKFLFDGPIYHQFGLSALVHHLLVEQQRGTALPFAIIHRRSKSAIGMTRFLNIQPANRSLEIATWFATAFHGTGVNSESKYLLLRHAFDVLNFVRVQFEIDARNEKSIEAIERIDATREGELRNHMILADDFQRTSAIYSVVADDWPHVREKLERRISKHGEPKADAVHIAHLERLCSNIEEQQDLLQKQKERVESILAMHRENKNGN